MLKLCDTAMEQLKAKDYNQVLASLYEYTDSTQEIKPLSEKTRKRYLNKFKTFPVLEYTRIYYSFQLEGCNDVKYAVTLLQQNRLVLRNLQKHRTCLIL